jgi:hypothetical protein
MDPFDESYENQEQEESGEEYQFLWFILSGLVGLAALKDPGKFSWLWSGIKTIQGYAKYIFTTYLN